MSAAKKVKVETIEKNLDLSIKSLMQELEVKEVERHVSPQGGTNLASHSYIVTRPIFSNFKRFPKNVHLELHFSNMSPESGEHYKHGVVCYPSIKPPKVRDGLILSQEMKFSFTPAVLTGELELNFERGKDNLATLLDLTHQAENDLRDHLTKVGDFFDKVIVEVLKFRLNKIQSKDYNWSTQAIRTHIKLHDIFPNLKRSDKVPLLEIIFMTQEFLLYDDLEVTRKGTEFVFKPLNNFFRRHEIRVAVSRASISFAKKEIKNFPIPLKKMKRDQGSGKLIPVKVSFNIRHFKDSFFRERGKSEVPYKKTTS